MNASRLHKLERNYEDVMVTDFVVPKGVLLYISQSNMFFIGNGITRLDEAGLRLYVGTPPPDGDGGDGGDGGGGVDE